MSVTDTGGTRRFGLLVVRRTRRCRNCGKRATTYELEAADMRRLCRPEETK